MNSIVGSDSRLSNHNRQFEIDSRLDKFMIEKYGEIINKLRDRSNNSPYGTAWILLNLPQNSQDIGRELRFLENWARDGDIDSERETAAYSIYSILAEKWNLNMPDKFSKNLNQSVQLYFVERSGSGITPQITPEYLFAISISYRWLNDENRKFVEEKISELEKINQEDSVRKSYLMGAAVEIGDKNRVKEYFESLNKEEIKGSDLIATSWILCQYKSELQEIIGESFQDTFSDKMQKFQNYIVDTNLEGFSITNHSKISRSLGFIVNRDYEFVPSEKVEDRKSFREKVEESEEKVDRIRTREGISIVAVGVLWGIILYGTGILPENSWIREVLNVSPLFLISYGLYRAFKHPITDLLKDIVG